MASFDLYPSKELAESLTEEALKLRLKSTEYDFVERKPLKPKSDWLQVAVAFANSAPIGYPAILFVGVSDDGTAQESLSKLEDLEKSVADTLRQAYPSIYYHLVPLHFTDRGCLAVVIPGSERRPHFAGRAYVRRGPQIIEASDDQYDLLIAERDPIVRRLRSNLGSPVRVEEFKKHYTGAQKEWTGVITDCNALYVTVRNEHGKLHSFPVRRLDLTYNHSQNVLTIQSSEP